MQDAYQPGATGNDQSKSEGTAKERIPRANISASGDCWVSISYGKVGKGQRLGSYCSSLYATGRKLVRRYGALR